MMTERGRRGFTLLELLVVIAIIGLLIGLTAAAVQRVRGQADRAQCQNRLRQIGLALHSYHDSAGSLPAGVSGEQPNEPQPFLSWCARLLPYLGEDAMWAQTEAAFQADKDSLHDPPHVGLGTPVRHFMCPSDPRIRTAHRFGKRGERPRAFTSFLGVNGTDAVAEDGVLFLDSRVRLTDITDGTTNTLAVGERPPSADLILGWWYAGWGQDKDGEADSVGAKLPGRPLPLPARQVR
jgi:prepilin-type N-terminal cleavage/methylation domain-containing protein